MKCDICGARINGAGEACPKCGARHDTQPQRLCSTCGSVIPGNSVFCRICGAEQRTAPVSGVAFRGGAQLPERREIQKKHRRDTKQRVIRGLRGMPMRFKAAAGAAVAVVLLSIVLMTALAVRGGAAAGTALGLALESSLQGAYDEAGERFVFTDSTGSIVEVPCAGLLSWRYSRNRAAWVLLIDAGADERGNQSCSLVIVSKAGAVTLSDKAYPDSVTLSGNGEGVAFMMDADSRDNATLCLWNSGSSHAKKLASNAKMGSGIAVSPDGETVAWIGNYVSNDEYSAYISRKGVSSELGAGITPFAVSDKGELVYCIRDGGVCVLCEDQVRELTDAVGYTNMYEYYMTSDLKQVVYNMRGSAYISINGAPGVKIAGAWAEGAVSGELPSVLYRGSGVMCVVYPVKSFAGSVLKLDGGLWYLNKNMQATRITDSFDRTAISASGASLLWESDGLLYRIKNLSDESYAVSPVYDAGSVTSAAADSRLSKVFLCVDGDIVQVSTSTGSKAVIANADDAVLRAIISGRLYYTADGGLFSVRRGSRVKTVVEGQIVSAVQTGGGLYVKTTDSALFVTAEGRLIKLF